MAQNITIPPASNHTLLPSNAEFQITATQSCTVCFSVASTPGTFGGIAGKTFQCAVGQILGPYPIPGTGASVNFNTSAPNSICNPQGVTGTGHVIVVGTGRKRSRKKSRKAPAKKKAAAKKATSKAASRRKPAKKSVRKAGKKATKKTAKKAAKKKAAKRKSAKKSRR